MTETKSERRRRLTATVLAGLVFFPPFIAGINFAQPTAPEFAWLGFSWWLFSLAGSVFQLVVLALVFVRLLAPAGEEPRFRRRTPTAAILFFLLIFFLFSIFRSVNLNESLKLSFQFLAYGWFFWLSEDCLRGERETVFLSGAVIAAAIVVAGYGLWQYFFVFERLKEIAGSLSPPHLAELLRRIEARRVFSTFAYPPALAGYLILVFPAALAVFLSLPPRRQGLFLFPLVILLLALYLTFSRAAWAAGALAVAVYFRLSGGGEKGKPGNRLVPVLCLLAFAIVCIFLISLYAGRLPRTLAAADSLRLRLGYWRTTAEMIKERCFSGFGPGTFGTVYPRYQLPGTGVSQLAHNCFLQIWAESGLGAFLCVTALAAAFCLQGWTFIRRLPAEKAKERNFLAGVYSGLVAFFLHSLVDVDFYVPGIAVTAVFFLALFRATAARLEPEEPPGTGGGRAGRRLAAALAIAVMIAVLRFALAGNSAEQARWFREQGEGARAEAALRRATRVNPFCADYHFYLASWIYENRMLAADDERVKDAWRKEAAAGYRRAIERNRYSAFYHYRLGRIYLAGGKEENERARAELELASFFYPTRAFYHQELARFYESAGENEKARAEWEKAGEPEETTK